MGNFAEIPSWVTVFRVAKTLARFHVALDVLSVELVMAFAIFRVEKITSWGKLSQAGAHVARRREVLNADPRRETVTLIGSGDAAADVRQRIVGAGLDPSHLRKNGVLAIELLLTASPEFFRPGRREAAGEWDADRLASWRDATLKHLREQWGTNVVTARLHLDEASPHIHAFAVPVDTTPRKRGATVRLNAARWLDGRDKLSALQDAYADAMKPLGLERGVKGSKAHHEAIARRYATIHGDARAAEEMSTRAALSLGAAEAERRAAATARQAADRDRATAAKTREAAERDRRQAAAFSLGVEAIADGRIVGTTGTEEKPELTFAPMAKTAEEKLRADLRPAWTAVWRVARLVEQRVQKAIGAALVQAEHYLAAARQAYDRARALKSALPARARARASLLGAALAQANNREPSGGRSVRDR